ncbi:uncharacterized protein [Rutidosis leptorrhynchoides]|uniref:uncharacterized protein n=1 Tax=Rutidosis leptorrhynchoides TaxID=125765 RepID=UPI003A9991C5
MADNEANATGPTAPGTGTFRAPDEDGHVSSEEENSQEVINLQSRLLEAQEKIKELEQERTQWNPNTTALNTNFPPNYYNQAGGSSQSQFPQNTYQNLQMPFPFNQNTGLYMMDSTWMSLCRSSPAYKKGLDKFIERIFSKKGKDGHIYCPCKYCGNHKRFDRVQAKTHLLCDGFFEGYKIPNVYFKPDDTPTFEDADDDDMQALAQCVFNVFEDEDEDEDDIQQTENQTVPNLNAEKFNKVLEDAKKELYTGCKFSVLSFIVRLFHSKCVGKCNEKGFSMILDTMREAFLHAAIPKSLYELRKIIRDLGLGYEKIDACPNDCMLYWKENKDKIKCDVCQTSRYKQINNDSENESTTEVDNDGDYKAKKVGAKVLRYFPLIPRLQRLFMSPKTTGSMRWHEESHTKDGRLRYPADSPAWKTFDYENKEFAKEPRNVRLGLASDGFNPFGNMSVSHSTWPVVLMPYNLPPWLCMKKPFLFLSLLIPGPSAPGNNIDVYMQPLVDELKELWDIGVNTYDASTKSYFTLCAYLLWTVSDFPAYTNLSGWSTKGKLACPSCHKETRLTRLSNSHKEIFMAHRRWLESLHPFRMDKDSFDGTEEREGPPRSLTGEQVLAELKGFEIKFGKLVKDNPSLPYNWKKRNGKTKDHLKGRRDLEEMGIRHELHSEPLSNGKVYLPPACFEMDKKKKKKNFVIQLCSKVLNPNDLFNMEKDIGKILCDLERIFPPSFFDVMIHLSVHLASEARLGGPVHYRWMYPIERYLGTLKSYVRNKSKPEGSIAEGYLAEECLSFCSLYLASDVETIHNKTSRNHDDGGDDTVLPILCMPGRPIGATNVVKLGYDTLAIAHSHVLFNCSEIDFLRTEHLNILSHQNLKRCKRDIQHLHSQEFEEWLSDYVDEDMTSQDNRITSDIETLANCPNEALTSSFSSARDSDHIVGDVTYYGVLKDIIKLQYGDEKKVVLFHCDWISSGSRIKVDENGFTTLDFRGLKQTKEPYILASQAQRVFYVADPVRKDWKVVIKTTPKDNFDMDGQICIDDVETHLQSDTPMGPQLVENETIDMVRGDLDGSIVDDDTLVAATDKNQIDHDQGRICECSTCVLEQGS